MEAPEPQVCHGRAELEHALELACSSIGPITVSKPSSKRTLGTPST
jgi:hypothetical protein